MIVVGNLAKDLLIWTGGLAISVVKSTFGAFFDLGNIAGNVIGELVADTIENFLDSIKSNSSYAKAIEGFKDAIEENENFGAKIERILADLTGAGSVEECFPSGRGFKARKERKRFQRALQGKLQTIALLASRNGIDGALGELSKTYCGLGKEEKKIFRDVFDNVYHQAVSLLTQDMSAADKRMVAVLGFMINMNADMTRSFVRQYPQGIITLSEGKARFTHYACAQCGSGSEALIDLDDGYICTACGQRTKVCIAEARIKDVKLPQEIVAKINFITEQVMEVRNDTSWLTKNEKAKKENEQKIIDALKKALSLERPSYEQLEQAARAIMTFDNDNVYAAFANYVCNGSAKYYRDEFLNKLKECKETISDETLEWMLDVIGKFILDSASYVKVSQELFGSISSKYPKRSTIKTTIETEQQKLDAGYYNANTKRDLFVVYAEAYDESGDKTETYNENRQQIKGLVQALEKCGVTCFVSFLNTKWQRSEAYTTKLDVAESHCQGALVLYSDYLVTRSGTESINEINNMKDKGLCSVRLQYKMPGTHHELSYYANRLDDNKVQINVRAINDFFNDPHVSAEPGYIDYSDVNQAAQKIKERYEALKNKPRKTLGVMFCTTCGQPHDYTFRTKCENSNCPTNKPSGPRFDLDGDFTKVITTIVGKRRNDFVLELLKKLGVPVNKNDDVSSIPVVQQLMRNSINETVENRTAALNVKIQTLEETLQKQKAQQITDAQKKTGITARPVTTASESNVYSPEWVKDKTFIGQVPETIAKLIFKSCDAWKVGTVQVFPQYLRDQVAEISKVEGADGFLYNGVMLRRLRKKAGAGDPKAIYLLAKRYVGLYKRLRRKSDKLNNTTEVAAKAEHLSAAAKAAAKARHLLAAAAVLHNYMPTIERYSKDYIYDYQEKAELLSYVAVSGNAELLPKAMQIGDRWTCSLPVGKSREVHSGNLALVGDYYAILSQSNDDKWAAMYYACSSYAARYYSIDAYDGLADCYSEGKGAKQNKKRAIKYRLAAFLNLNPRIWLLYAITICVSALCMWMIYVNYFSPKVLPLQYASTLVWLCVLPIAWILFLVNLVHYVSLFRDSFFISNTVCSWIIWMLIIISAAPLTGQFRGVSFVDAPYVFYTDTYVTDDPDSWWVELYGDYENETELVFPSEVGDRNIRAINDNACAGMTSLESIVIPVEIDDIGDNAFNGCVALEYVYYGGTTEEWARMRIEPGNEAINNAEVYFYSEEEPPLVEDGSAYDGNYWHWVDGRAAVWTPTASVTS